MQVCFLGTGAGMPSLKRNVTAIAVQFPGESGWWLFDCGEATQLQIMRSPLRMSRLTHIFITHLHGDHVYGLPGLLGTRSFQAPGRPLTIIGPPDLRRYLQTMLETSGAHLSFPLRIIEIGSGTVHQDEARAVEADWLSHPVPSLGYRIQEHPRPGHLRPDRLQRLGITPGPLYQQLKEGRAVQTASGKVVHPEDVLSPATPGLTLTILGDTAPCPAIMNLARNADALVHESTYPEEDADKAAQFGHSTSVQAASAARSAGAKHLILTHISARYTDETALALVNEARSVFPNTSLAADGRCFDLVRGTCAPASF